MSESVIFCIFHIFHLHQMSSPGSQNSWEIIHSRIKETMKQLERNKSKYVKSWRLGTPVLHVLVAIGPLDYTDVFIPTYMYLFLHLFIYLNMSLLVNRSTNLSMLIFYTVFPPNWVFMARATFVPSCCIDPGLFHFVKTNKEKRKTTPKKLFLHHVS